MVTIYKLVSVAVLLCGSFFVSYADTCSTCVFPCLPNPTATLELVPRSGKDAPRMQFTSIVRDTIGGLTIRQALRCVYTVNGRCIDTIVPLSSIDGVNMAGSLGKTPPIYVPVLPSRVFEKTDVPVVPTHWLEVGAFLGYGGSDKSVPNSIPVGFNSVLYGAEALVNPFGHLYGEHLDLAVGGGLMRESSRLRFNAMAHLRWNFGGYRQRVRTRYVPSACTFQCSKSITDTLRAPEGFVEVPADGNTDPSVYLAREVVIERSAFRPFVYVDGGLLFPTDFEGSGADPSVNPDDYGEYAIGAGVGVPIADVITVKLGYRYWRLNLRTPCPTCNDVDILNTNNAHTVQLAVSYILGW